MHSHGPSGPPYSTTTVNVFSYLHSKQNLWFDMYAINQQLKNETIQCFFFCSFLFFFTLTPLLFKGTNFSSPLKTINMSLWSLPIVLTGNGRMNVVWFFDMVLYRQSRWAGFKITYGFSPRKYALTTSFFIRFWSFVLIWIISILFTPHSQIKY